MIREQDVREAIAEMQGQKNPNSNTCIKLAAYYTILDHILEPQNNALPYEQRYSSEQKHADTIEYDSGSEFSSKIIGQDSNKIWSIMDELMDTLSIINPKLYASVIRKVAE